MLKLLILIRLLIVISKFCKLLQKLILLSLKNWNFSKLKDRKCDKE